MNGKPGARHGTLAGVRFENLPPAIADKLRESVQRVRRIFWMRGLVATVATALVSILIVMGIDAAVVIYSPAVRWMLTFAVVGSTAFAIWRMLVRPLSKPFTPARIAAIIEQRHPELEERLSTVVELLSGNGIGDRGSEQLFNVLTHEAETDARDVAPEQEFTTRTVKPKLRVAAAALGILGILFAAWPRHTGRLFARAIAPYAEIDNLYADQFLVSPGDHVMLVGDPLEILLTVSGESSGQAYVRREFRDAHGKRRELLERMRQVPSPEGLTGVRSFRHLFPAVDAPFRYRIACGHGLTRYYSVQAFDRPEVTATRAVLTFPSYTGREPLRLETGVADLEGVPGTSIALAADVNRKDLKGVLALGPQTLDAKVDPTQGSLGWTFDLVRGMDIRWSILLADPYGFTNFPSAYAVRAVPDQVPTLVLDRPEQKRIKLPPYAKVALEFTATDDFGLVVPDLWVGLGDAPMNRVRPVGAFEADGPGLWHGAETVDLASLGVSGVAQVRIQLEVSDNLPPALGGPQVARSAELVIELDHESLSLESQGLHEQAQNVEKTLEEVVERLKDAQETAKELAAKAEKKEPLTESDQQKLDEIRKDAALAEELTAKLAEEAKETAFDPLAEKLETLQEEKLTPAREQAEAAQMANPEEKPQAVEALKEKLDEALKAAQETLQESNEFAEQLEQVAAMDEMAMKEEALAEAAATAETPEQMDEWQQMQEQLTADMKEMLAQNPEALLGELEERKEALQDLAQETKELASAQEQLRQETQALADPNQREQAAAKLREAQPEAPAEATPEQLAAMQEKQIAEQAADLAERTQELHKDLQEFGEPTAPLAQPSQQAAQELGKAEQKAEAAAQALAQPPQQQPGQPPPPPPAAMQQEARQALENAAKSLEDTGKAMEQLMQQLGEQAQAMAEAGEPLPDEGLRQALDLMEQAAASAEAAQAQPPPAPPGEPTPPPPETPGAPAQAPLQQASQQAAQAAQKMQQMAQQAARQLNIPLPTLPSQQTNPSQAMAAMRREVTSTSKRTQDPVPEVLREIVSQDDWFRMRGELRSGAMEDALRSVPPEYRELVRLYFRELSRQKATP